MTREREKIRHTYNGGKRDRHTSIHSIQRGEGTINNGYSIRYYSMVQAARPSRVAVALRLRQRPIDSCRTMRDSRRFGHDEYLVGMDRLSSAPSQGDETEGGDGEVVPGMDNKIDFVADFIPNRR